MNLCERHGRLRCDECAYVDELKERIADLQRALEEISTHVGVVTSSQFFQDSYLEVKKIATKALVGS